MLLQPGNELITMLRPVDFTLSDADFMAGIRGTIDMKWQQKS